MILAIVMASASVMAKDVLYLKNGSVIKGEILEFNMGGNVKIQTSDGSLFVYGTDQVEKLEKESDVPQVKIDVKPQVNDLPRESHSVDIIGTDVESGNIWNDFRHKGYRGFVDLGGFVGLNNTFDSYAAFMLSTSHGYQINPYFYFGVGIGVNVYKYHSSYTWTELEDADAFIPFYVDFRVFPIGRKRVTPFVGMKLGYSVSTMEDVENGGNFGGFYHQYSAGISVAILSNFGWYLSLGFSGQNISGLEKWVDQAKYSGVDFVKGHNLNGLAIQTGFDF